MRETVAHQKLSPDVDGTGWRLDIEHHERRHGAGKPPDQQVQLGRGQRWIASSVEAQHRHLLCSLHHCADVQDVGRILNIGSYPMLDRMENRLESRPMPASIPGKSYVVAVSFDAAEIDGILSPIHLRFDQVDAALAGKVVLARGNRWPENSMIFKTTESHYVIPRGFKSEWITTK